MTDEITRVAAVAMHRDMGTWATNLTAVESWYRRARERGAEFALFPEECVTGSLNRSDLDLAATREIVRVAEAETRPRLETLCCELAMTVVVGTIESAGDRFANSALVVGPAGYMATCTKLHLPNAGEKAWFVAGEQFPVVTSRGWTFGVGICHDLRFPEIFRTAAQHGADFFLLPVGGSGGESGSEQVQYHKQLAMQLMPARGARDAIQRPKRSPISMPPHGGLEAEVGSSRTSSSCATLESKKYASQRRSARPGRIRAGRGLEA